MKELLDRADAAMYEQKAACRKSGKATVADEAACTGAARGRNRRSGSGGDAALTMQVEGPLIVISRHAETSVALLGTFAQPNPFPEFASHLSSFQS